MRTGRCRIHNSEIGDPHSRTFITYLVFTTIVEHRSSTYTAVLVSQQQQKKSRYVLCAMCCLLLGHGQLAIGKKSRAEEESVGVSMYVVKVYILT